VGGHCSKGLEHNKETSIKAVPAAAAALSLLLPPAALLPQQLHELGGVVQQQRADGDVRDAAEHNARTEQVVSLPYTHGKIKKNQGRKMTTKEFKLDQELSGLKGDIFFSLQSVDELLPRTTSKMTSFVDSVELEGLEISFRIRWSVMPHKAMDKANGDRQDTALWNS